MKLLKIDVTGILFPSYIRKKKIASSVSGRTRFTGRFRRNLLNSDADRHGICLPDEAWQAIFLLEAAVSGHFPSGRSCVRAFSFWTQLSQGIFLLDASRRRVS